MSARNRVVRDLQIAITSAANDDGFLVEGMAAAHAGAGWVDVHEASRRRLAGSRPRSGDPGFRAGWAHTDSILTHVLRNHGRNCVVVVVVTTRFTRAVGFWRSTVTGSRVMRSP